MSRDILTYLNVVKTLLSKIYATYKQSFIAASSENYYTEIFNNLTDYNDRSNMPLSNSKIQEAIYKVIEEESIDDANNFTAYAFSLASNTQRWNTNAIFTSEKLDESEELVDQVKNLKINNAEYHESNTATASDAQGNPKRNPDTVTHNINRNKTVNHTSHGNFEQKSLSNRTIPFFPPAMHPGICQGIAPIQLAPQILLAHKTKEVVAYTASGGAG